MTTFSMLAPTAGQTFAPLSGNSYTADARGIITGVVLGDVRDLTVAGCVPLGAGTLNDSAFWNNDQTAPQLLAAAGATQGDAAAITNRRVVVTPSASSEGVILKSVATGAQTGVVVPGTKGVKVYPPVGKLIDAGSTNGAVALAAGKGSIYEQRANGNFVTRVKGA